MTQNTTQEHLLPTRTGFVDQESCVKARETIIAEQICSANFTFTRDSLSVWLCEGSYNWHLEVKHNVIQSVTENRKIMKQHPHLLRLTSKIDTWKMLSYFFLHFMKSWPSQISQQSPSWFLEDWKFIWIKPLFDMLKPLHEWHVAYKKSVLKTWLWPPSFKLRSPHFFHVSVLFIVITP